MGRVEDAIERVSRARKGVDQASPANHIAPNAGHENDMRVVAARHLDRFPLETETAPPTPVPQSKPAVRRPPSVPAAPKQARSKTLQQAEPPPVGPQRQTAWSAAVADKLVTMNETNGVAIEQYRKIAATLHQRQVERHSKVVLIASAVSGEGKTLTAMNLALTLSQSFRQRVLLVDADLRRPQIHTLLQLPVMSGLNEGLRSSEELSLQIFRISQNLFLLPAGKPDPDPMSVLTSDRMRHLVTEASAAFDWVILDSPPVAHLPDAHLLAAMADLAVVVVAAGRTPYTAIARAVEMLGKERVAGIVLNQVEDSALDASRRLARGSSNGNGADSDDDYQD